VHGFKHAAQELSAIRSTHSDCAQGDLLLLNKLLSEEHANDVDELYPVSLTGQHEDKFF
jgi:hypothetical protein